jgi:replication factor A1
MYDACYANIPESIKFLSLLLLLLLLLFFNLAVDLMKAGATVIVRNAKIDMFKGSMRLAVDKWGRVEGTEPADFTVKEDNNLSLVEFELVTVVEE